MILLEQVTNRSVYGRNSRSLRSRWETNLIHLHWWRNCSSFSFHSIKNGLNGEKSECLWRRRWAESEWIFLVVLLPIRKPIWNKLPREIGREHVKFVSLDNSPRLMDAGQGDGRIPYGKSKNLWSSLTDKNTTTANLQKIVSITIENLYRKKEENISEEVLRCGGGTALSIRPFILYFPYPDFLVYIMYSRLDIFYLKSKRKDKWKKYIAKRRGIFPFRFIYFYGSSGGGCFSTSWWIHVGIAI